MRSSAGNTGGLVGRDNGLTIKFSYTTSAVYGVGMGGLIGVAAAAAGIIRKATASYYLDDATTAIDDGLVNIQRK